MNKTAIFYDDKGMITRIRTGPTANVEATVEESEGAYIYFDDRPDTDNKYVVDEELVAMPSQPSSNHHFDYDTKEWVLDLEEAKLDKWTEIKGNREETEFGSFTKDDLTFQSDSKSQSRIQGAVQRSQADPSISIDWTLADNTTQTFTGTEYIEVGNALSAHVAACHVKATTLRGQINSATTLEEINAITW